MSPKIPLLTIALALIAPAASAQYLLVVESTNKRVLLLSDFDGSVVNPAYINLTAGGAATPIEAGIVGGEIWVSDQIVDGLMRFTLDGTTFLGTHLGGLDNVRGFAYANGEIYVANAGNGGSGFNDAVVRFTTAWTNLGNAASPDPFDVCPFNGELLVADGTTDDLRRYDYALNYLGNFHSSDGVTGIDWVEQIVVRANGNVLATNFSAPIGIYEYDPSGNQLNYWPCGTGNRGVAELGNGLLLWTDGSGIHTIDPSSLATADIMTGINARFVTRFLGPPPPLVSFCLGDGSGGVCPCGNSGATGNGCASSTFAGGARLSASGLPGVSAGTDTLVLTATDVPGPGLFFQGTTHHPAIGGAQFGDGLLCVAGSILRLGVVFPTGTSSSYPGGSTANPIHIGGGPLVAGDVRHYQCWYRDAAVFCNVQTFNLTQALTLTWTP